MQPTHFLNTQDWSRADLDALLARAAFVHPARQNEKTQPVGWV